MSTCKVAVGGCLTSVHVLDGMDGPNSVLCNAQDGCNWMSLGVKRDVKVNSAALAFITVFKQIFVLFQTV